MAKCSAFLLQSLVFTAPLWSQNQPFGLRFGMTKDEVTKLVGRAAVRQQESDSLMLSTVPRPHSHFKEYVVLFSPTKGLVKIMAVGQTVETNGYGVEMREEFSQILINCPRSHLWHPFNSRRPPRWQHLERATRLDDGAAEKGAHADGLL